MIVTYDPKVQEEYINDYVDTNFPFKAARPYLDPNRVTYIKAVPLQGNRPFYVQHFDPNGERVSRLELFGKWCEELSCYTNPDQFGGRAIKLDITRKYICIERNDGERLGSITEIVKLFYQAYNKAMEKEKIGFSFDPPPPLEFLDDVKLVRNVLLKQNDEHQLVKCPEGDTTLIECLDRELEHRGPLSRVEEVRLKYTDPWELGPCDNKTYLKVNDLWLTLSGNFLSVVDECYQEVLHEIKVKREDVGLDLKWTYMWKKVKKEWELKPEDEGYYNEKYNGNGFLVGDDVKPANIELFDLLRRDGDGIILYHVKKGLNRDSRDVCSQIYNSARVITFARQSDDNVMFNHFVELLGKGETLSRLPDVKKFFQLQAQALPYEIKEKFRDLTQVYHGVA